jgi:hypothetical protein
VLYGFDTHELFRRPRLHALATARSPNREPAFDRHRSRSKRQQLLIECPCAFDSIIETPGQSRYADLRGTRPALGPAPSSHQDCADAFPERRDRVPRLTLRRGGVDVEEGPIDLVRLVGSGNSVTVRVTGRDAVGDPQVLVGEFIVATKFLKGTRRTWIFPQDLTAWEAVLDSLTRGENAAWRKGKSATELHVELAAPDLHAGQVRVSVADREGSRTTALVVLEPADGWIEDHRARLDKVRQAWPQPLA